MAIWLIGGDTRCFWTAQHLRNNGLEILTYGVPNLPDTPLPARLPCAVLPFPSFQGALIRGRSAVPAEEVLCRAERGTRIFGAMFGAWREEFEKNGAQVTELYDSEPLTTANAVPTAEGAIQLAMEQSAITLHGSNCLVIGFGRIGKLLAEKLHALCANVTVAARKTADRALAEALGLLSEETGVYRHGLGQYDFVFNTVPAPTLSEVQLKQLSPECLLIELASSPGGFSFAACEALGVSCHLASGLPGRCAPKTAGALYAQSILNILATEEIL